MQIEKKKLATLAKLGVKDSKLVAPKKREVLAREIRRKAKAIKLIVISAKKIDQLRQKMSLNQIELWAFARVINELRDNEVYLDLPEPGKKWIYTLKKKISPSVKVVAEHKADARYPIVGAASIIAKTERDKRIREIEKRIGLEIRSGYPADPHVVQFLKKWLRTHKEFPDFVRKSWKTARRLAGAKKQRSLAAYKKKKQKKLVEFKSK